MFNFQMYCMLKHCHFLLKKIEMPLLFFQKKILENCVCRTQVMPWCPAEVAPSCHIPIPQHIDTTLKTWYLICQSCKCGHFFENYIFIFNVLIASFQFHIDCLQTLRGGWYTNWLHHVCAKFKIDGLKTVDKVTTCTTYWSLTLKLSKLKIPEFC